MRLYNTLTRQVEEFIPRQPGRVDMYVCGPTVYDVPHFGHARAAIVPDVLRRYLAWSGYQVFCVRNVTDIEDKIINRAAEEGRPSAAVAEHYTRVYDQQVDRLGILPPDVAPRATGHVLEMIGLIERLLERGHAYIADGDVLFSVRAWPDYGKLSGRNVDELRAGARIEPSQAKRDPLDFTLWKAAKEDEPSWPSPWGPGRPGWHIECSAMSTKYLGSGFDIHAGGLDLIFPHHENEIAQAEAATGEPFARYWVHNGLLSVGGEKMSKSLGNFVTLSEALERYGANTLRFFYLAAHYRSPVELSVERLDEASEAFARLRAFERATRGHDQERSAPDAEGKEVVERFREAMDEDLSTPGAHAGLFDLVAAGNQHLSAGRRDDAAALRPAFLELAGVLGYRFDEAEHEAGLVTPLVAELLRLREEARARRDFTTADGIRDRLGALGIVVEDSPSGPRWYRGEAPTPDGR